MPDLQKLLSTENLLELIFLDVDHGNSSVSIDSMGIVTAVDCGYDGSTLIQTLEQLGIETIDHLIISHADADHCGGLLPVLEQFFVRNLYINANASKKSQIWHDIALALEIAEDRGTIVHVGLITRYSGKITAGEVQIEILSSSPSLAVIGPGGKLEGHPLDSNTLSVVVGLVHKGCRIALLPGDMDEFSLNHLLKKHENIEAKILVFPHHGGSSGGGNDYAFAHRLTSLAKPELIVLSLHRSFHNNPKEEIIQGIRDACPTAHIMCTELSQKCCPNPHSFSMNHLTNLPAKGKGKRACCGGSIHILFDGEQIVYNPSLDIHRQFVETLMDDATRFGQAGPLCLRSFGQAQPIS